ncbi:necrosis inducing protein [Colletotrichum orchidophilum]|uniref:Necrosis inducing protein n=1 Tax=Colletotrichum orchidophilum TaxID=1209926 RepID=A0A1G4B6Y9_9PEZI|nr:necrosis inducing protein [Colletotrichum orchidophilum]OHE97035.1 necrosis inducing protein [Colletotrichum orchidophilum]
MAPSLFRLGAWLAAAAGSVTAAPLERRAVIDHDAVVGFPETVPSGIVGSLYLKYKPYLKIINGCVPYPAVNAAGDTSGGLAPTGSPEGGCSSSTGQVYARGATYNGAFAIMYSYYMPKDSPSTGLGHRHEWENAVVWLSAATDSATVLGVSVSAHGEYDTKTSGIDFTGNSPRIGYRSIWPVNHQMIFTSEVGDQQPLIAWESLTPAARTALENTDFGSANVPMKEANFDDNLGKAVLFDRNACDKGRTLLTVHATEAWSCLEIVQGEFLPPAEEGNGTPMQATQIAEDHTAHHNQLTAG